MRTPLVLSILLVQFAAGCMTERVRPVTEYPSVPKQSTFLVKKIGYDAHGRPMLCDRLGSRPGSAGEQFTVIHAINDRPSRSYDIAIAEQPKTGPGPLAVIYSWTGRGFDGGVAIAEGLFLRGATISSREEAAIYLALKTAPVVIATATGFIVGVIASIPETAIELKRVIVNARETVIGYRSYAYDERGRIRFIKLYPPEEHADALVKTEFFYEGEGDVPARTEVTSVAEKKVRVVR
jgi:hypothetical protein